MLELISFTVIIQFIVQEETLLRVKGGIINNEARIIAKCQDCALKI